MHSAPTTTAAAAAATCAVALMDMSSLPGSPGPGLWENHPPDRQRPQRRSTNGVHIHAFGTTTLWAGRRTRSFEHPQTGGQVPEVSSRTPPYARIAAELADRIAAGELRPGDRVPSTREITRTWGVAMATATKVLPGCATRVWSAEPGRGTVVADPPPRRPGTPAAARPTEPPPHRPAPAPGPNTGSGVRAGHDHALTRDRIVRAAIELADREGSARCPCAGSPPSWAWPPCRSTGTCRARTRC